VVPILVLEMVSHRPGSEYEEKFEIYQNLGVLYYLIYNPEFWRRDGHQPFELYQLIDGRYELQIGEPYWMEEVGLGMGRSRQMIGGIEQEILTWFDGNGVGEVLPDVTVRELRSRLREQQLALDEVLERLRMEQQAKETERQAKEIAQQAKEAERQAKEVAQQQVDRLSAYLRSQGIDPDRLPE
jgi:Putative restriction endonuclease